MRIHGIGQISEDERAVFRSTGPARAAWAAVLADACEAIEQGAPAAAVRRAERMAERAWTRALDAARAVAGVVVSFVPADAAAVRRVARALARLL